MVPAGAQSAPEEVLPAGTLLQCTLDEPSLSSQTVQRGDPVLCHTGTVAAFGRSVFPRGAYLGGHFQEHRDPGHFFGKGWIDLEFDRLILPGGLVLPLSARVISVPHLGVDREGKIHGRGHPKRDAVGWAIPALWPEKVLTLPARGPRPTLRGEVRITLRLLADVEVPAAGASARRTSGGAESSPYLPSTGSSTPTREEAPVLKLSAFAESPSARQVTLLLFKDRTGYLACDYWLEAGVLHYVTSTGESKLLPLERLDLEETVKLNRQRNVEFVLQDSQEMTLDAGRDGPP